MIPTCRCGKVDYDLGWTEDGTCITKCDECREEEMEREENMLKREGLCDENCNRCPLMDEQNAKILTVIFNVSYEKFGDAFYKIVEYACPNLTCCFDCHIDDFCHVEGCKLLKRAEEFKKELEREENNGKSSNQE